MLNPIPRSQRNFRAADLRTPALARALAYWDALLAEHDRLPVYGDLDPLHMRPFLPYVLLVDVIRGADRRVADFRFRLAGTAVVARYRIELRGRHLSELDLDGKGDEIAAAYLQTVVWAAPQYSIDAFTRHDGHFMHYERLLMPLATSGGQVDCLFGVQTSRVVP